jgi:predicted phage terminase large subunit-like protein
MNPIELGRLATIEWCKRSFWKFCKTLAPDFYAENRKYLKKYCDTLQALYEGALLDKWNKPYRNLVVEMPPRHGKSRTLTLFSAWLLGKNNKNKVVTASFDDDLAQSFSRNTRDIITEKKASKNEIVFSDIFDAQIKQGNASYKEWALDGQFFSYKGAGIGGAITGKGGNVLIMDDLVKGAATAYNENELEKIWLWYSGTFIQRAERAIKILSMTPWCSKDPGARIMAKQPEKWFILSMPACVDGEMLCPEILSYEDYMDIKSIGDQKIISANYDLERIDVAGSLYKELKTYDTLPDCPEGFVAYTDTADEGKDYLCSILAQQKAGLLYVTDVIYTQDPQEITEPLLVNALSRNKTRQCTIESNNGGRAFARNVERLLRDKQGSCSVDWFHQSENKVSRILTNAPIVKDKLLMPVGWEHKWPEFYKAMIGFQREGKNKHDDAPDCATGICEKFLASTSWALL